MSVIWTNENGWIVCHSEFLSRIYDCIQCENLCPSCGRYQVFHVDSPFLKHGQKNYCETIFDNEDVGNISNRNELGNYSKENFKIDEVIVLSQLFKSFMRACILEKVQYMLMRCDRSQGCNLLAVKATDKLLRNTKGKLDGNYDGGNDSENAVAVTLEKEVYFIPPRCRFYNCSVEQMTNKFENTLHPMYDLILIDPPWPNKHIKRQNASSAYRGYSVMKIDEIIQLPIRKLLSSDGLVAVWCTNSVQQIKALINDVFPAWNIQYLCTWYWIKITQNGQPICEFSTRANKKQPFERIIFGSVSNRYQHRKNPPPNKIIVSIPSSVHSHKPPLVDVLKEYLPLNSHRIEFFARYLLPDWTSCGNEVLRLQHQSLFC